MNSVVNNPLREEITKAVDNISASIKQGYRTVYDDIASTDKQFKE